MSELNLDWGALRADAKVHEDAGEALHSVLDTFSPDIDGGVGAELMGALIAQAMTEAGKFADAHAVVGGVMRSIADAVVRTDESAQDAFRPLVQGLMGE